MKLLRWLLIVAALAWSAVAGVQWTTGIPLAPVVRFRNDDALAFRGFNRAGELVLVHVRSPAKGRSRGDMGPVEFWSFPQLVKQREVFKSDDEIESLAVEPHRPTIVRREGVPWIAELESGELSHQLPRQQQFLFVARRAGPSRLLITRGSDTSCYDFVEQREIWRLPNYEWPSLITPHFAVLQRVATGDPGFASHVIEEDLIDLTTGTVDERFKGLDVKSYRDFSPDGRQAVVITKDQLQVIDLESAGVVWGSADMRLDYFNVKFSAAGDELVVDSVAQDGTILTARIDAANGQVIEPGQGGKSGFKSVAATHVTADRRFAVYDTSRDPPFIDVAWRKFQFKTSRWVLWNIGPPPQGRPETVVYDMSSKRRLGFINPRQYKVTLSPASNAFALEKMTTERGASQWEVYSLPPGGNWGWFFRNVVLWPGVLLAAGWFCRRRQLPLTGGGPRPGSTTAA